MHPEAGTALFDGLDIRTDRMTDPRWDRVLPIFEDEQVLLTRLMQDRLAPAKLVLDVGTGSGVFAIWAAKKGRCRVVAIDVSDRAVEFGRENARRNGVPIAKDVASIQQGEILFVHQALEDFARTAPDQRTAFDLVMLNPPFNPTCGVFKPALHADAGPDAQRPFDQQINLVPPLIKVGGRCVGVQMSYDADDEHIRAIDVIREAFEGRGRITYTHAHSSPQTVSVDALVRYEYEPWLTGNKGSKSERAKVASYLMRLGGEGQRFSLIHYDVRKERSKVIEAPRHVRLPIAKQMSWEPRLWCHRCIAEFSSPWPDKRTRKRSN